MEALTPGAGVSPRSSVLGRLDLSPIHPHPGARTYKTTYLGYDYLHDHRTRSRN